MGQTVSVGGDHKIRAFRKLKTKNLPDRLKNRFKLSWCPIFRYLEERVTMDLPENKMLMTEGEFQSYYDGCVFVLKQRVSHAFKKKGGESCALALTVSTWSNRVQHSLIWKHGTESNKSFIEGPARRRGNTGAKRKRQPLLAARCI